MRFRLLIADRYPIPSGPLTAISDSNAAANEIAEGANIGTSAGLTLMATHPGRSVTMSLTESAVGRFQINGASGVVTAARTVTSPRGPLTSFLPYDLYDGGLCPVVATQVNSRWVDPINGSDSNNGQSVGAPWKSLRNKTVSNAVIYIIGSGTLSVASLGSSFHWMGSSTISNCTIRPTGETPVRLAQATLDTGACAFALRETDGSYSDITFYKIETDGWNQGWLVTDSPRIRWLRCKVIEPGGDSAHNQHHGWYVSGPTSVDLEWGYCEADNQRAFATGSVWQLYPEPGPKDYVMHHCFVKPGSRWTWGLIQDASGAADRLLFCNTWAGNYSNGALAMGYGDGGGTTITGMIFRSNIINQEASAVCIHSTAFANSVDFGGTNTMWREGGSSTVISGSALTVADWGVRRDPDLDANGVPQAAAERGSGDDLDNIPVHIDANLKIPSSATNVDRGCFQAGPTQTDVDTYKITAHAASSDGISTQTLDVDIEVV